MSHRQTKNLFANLASELTEELVEVLAAGDHIRIERIVSTGQCSPPGFWYDQGEHEWVVVLKGSARLLFEDEKEASLMLPGDHILIPAHRRHRVESTTREEATVWLAVFFAVDEEPN